MFTCHVAVQHGRGSSVPTVYHLPGELLLTCWTGFEELTQQTVDHRDAAGLGTSPTQVSLWMTVAQAADSSSPECLLQAGMPESGGTPLSSSFRSPVTLLRRVQTVGHIQMWPKCWSRPDVTKVLARARAT